MKRILCIGAGYVGGPTMAMIAFKSPDDVVTVVDINEDRIKAWLSGKPPIFEPGLADLVKKSLGKNLFFSSDVAGNIEKADIIFVSVNTPTKTFGLGAGRAADLQYWEKTARIILANSKTDKIVVEKSTLPVRTASAMARILHSGPGSVHFEVLSNPEFLAEGSAVRDLESPDRILIGGASTPAGQAAVKTLADVYAHWVPRERILTTNIWSSELSKLAANAMLAQRVSSINSLSALCEATEANIGEVARAVGTDSRIGPKFLSAGIGFGGSCFKKDILNMVYLCENYGLHQVAEYWRQVMVINDYQQERFVNRILSSMFNTVAGKRIAVLGFAFKANTGDTRESPAIAVCRRLVEERAEIVVSDPEALDNARRDLADLDGKVVFESDPYKAANGAHALVVLTEWPCYETLDFERVFKSMVQPAFLFDGRCRLDHGKLQKIGFSVYAIGHSPMTHV
ncbi:MAG: nucleotide sugar dehydrogenase [bacterium]